MSDFAKVLRGGAYLLSGTAVQAVVAFAANLVLARALQPSDFGRFAVVQALAGLVLAVISLRVNVLINRTPEGAMTDERRGLLMSVIALETIAAALIILGLVTMGGSVEPWDYALVASILLGHWLGFERSMIERLQQFRRVAVIETTAQVGGHILAVGLVLAGIGPAALYLRELFGALAMAAMLRMVGERSVVHFHFPTLAQWRQVFGAARGVWLDSMLENCFQRLTVLVAGAIGGQSGAGLLFQAQRLAIVPQQVFQSVFARSMGVWFCQTDNHNARVRLRRQVARWVIPLLLLAGVADVALADPVVPWLFGEQWRPVVPILVWLAGVVIFLPLFELLRVDAISTRRIRLLLLARVGQYVAFSLPLLPFLWREVELTQLGAALSLSFIAAFGILALALAHHERDIEARG